MTTSQILSTLLVLPGIFFLVASTVACFKTHSEVPAPLKGKWSALTGLIVFFIVGYLVFIAIQVKGLLLPVEIVTGIIFLGGAFFVFLVINLSRLTIQKVREAEQEVMVVNQSLLEKNAELEEEIEARMAAESRARTRLQHLSTLHAIDMVITASLDLRVTMKLLLEHTIPQLRVDAGNILLLNQHTQTLEYGAGWGFEGESITASRERVGEGSAGMAAHDRRLLHIADLKAEDSIFIRSDVVAEEGVRAYFALPLIAKGEVKGVLEIFNRKQFEAEPEWLDFLEALGVQAAIAIDNATLFRELQESNIELTLAYDTTIEGWSKALELRDSETEGHTQRATELTLKVARKMGIKENELDHIRRGALLHDIGKMAIPDSILLKPGPLTEEEQEIMRRHPVYAMELLAPIHYLKTALDIPYCHHEKWDGTGYPRGLKGEQIPLAARIFTIADIWDSLIHDRRYREAWSREKVVEHIRSLAGSQFDPALVDTFLSVA